MHFHLSYIQKYKELQIYINFSRYRRISAEEEQFESETECDDAAAKDGHSAQVSCDWRRRVT